MGSAFIGYGLLLVLMMRVGAPFLIRRKWSQEYLDAWVIMVWGVVNVSIWYLFHLAGTDLPARPSPSTTFSKPVVTGATKTWSVPLLPSDCL